MPEAEWERTEPELWADTCEKRVQFYENEFDNRLNAELAAMHLPGDTDSERALGKEIMQNTDSLLFSLMAHKLLEKSEHKSLLKEYWEI